MPASTDSSGGKGTSPPLLNESVARGKNPVDRLLRSLAHAALPNSGDPKQLLRMRRFFLAAGTSLLGTGLLLTCALEGALARDAFVELAALVAVMLIGFYALFRSGLNLKWKDPSLTMPQMLAATLIVLYGMYAANAGRGALVILLLMTFLFGVLHLRTRTLLLCALFILAAYGGVIGLLWQLKRNTVDLSRELLQWAALAITLPWFALMGGYISGLREQLRKSNAEQQAALQTLKARESTLAVAQRIAKLGSWSFDPVRRVAEWSLETYRIFGLDPAFSVPGPKDFLRLVYADDQRSYRDLLRRALADGRPFEGHFRIVRSSGDMRWLHTVGEAIVDRQGKATLLQGTVMDVTEHKTQEEAVALARDAAAAAQATLVDAIESLTEAFGLFDAEDRLILCNREYAELFTGHHRFEDIACMRFEDLVRSSLALGEAIEPAFANDMEAWVAERIRRHRNPESGPHELQLGDGRWLQVTERRTKAGGIVGVRRNITARKQSEQRHVMEHAVTRLLADSETIAEAMPRIIQTICETLGWDCGARWQWDKQEQVLRCAETWSGDSRELREFVALSSQSKFTPKSAGLIRRAWTSGEPVWIADVSREAGFLRAPLAAKAGLRAAFAFPIRIGAEPCGVMEFFLRNVRQPDPALLQVTNSIGLQIGQFIARMAAQEQIRRLAHFDFLTGMPNRNLFNELLSHALGKAQRRPTSLAILFIDLDGFKQVNDQFGHDAGDHLLVTFAQRLRECLRKSDAVARTSGSDTAVRLGGDEFVVLIDDFAARFDLEAIAQKILAVAAQPFQLAGPEGHISASIGISVYPADGTDIDTLTKNADSAMYSAKQAGKNTYRFFSPSMEDGARAPLNAGLGK